MIYFFRSSAFRSPIIISNFYSCLARIGVYIERLLISTPYLVNHYVQHLSPTSILLHPETATQALLGTGCDRL